MTSARMHAVILTLAAAGTLALGSAWAMSDDDPNEAKEHLAQLDKLCTFGCEEYSKLKKEIAQFEQRQAKR